MAFLSKCPGMGAGDAGAGAGAEDPNAPVKLLFSEHTPARFVGVPVEDLPRALLLHRNQTVYALVIEAFTALLSLPLGATRGGVAKIAAGINVFLLAISLLGLWATVKFRYLWVFAHAILVVGLFFLFVFFVILTAAVAEGNKSGDGGGEDLILLVVFVFITVDLVVGYLTYKFSGALSAYKAQVERGEIGNLVSDFIHISQNENENENENESNNNSHSGRDIEAGNAKVKNSTSEWGDSSAHAAVDAVVVADKRVKLQRAASSLEVPDSFICSITCCVMEEPVTLSDGHTYEKAAITRWLSNHDTSPLTGAVLGNKMFVPNHALRNAIEEVMSKRKTTVEHK